MGQYSLSLFDMMIYTSSTNTFWYCIQTNTSTYLFRYHNYSTFPLNHQILSLIKYTANVDIALYYPLSMYNYSRVLDIIYKNMEIQDRKLKSRTLEGKIKPLLEFYKRQNFIEGFTLDNDRINIVWKIP